MSDLGMPEKIQDKIFWLFILLPGFLSLTIGSLIVDFGELSEVRVVLYVFALTLIDLAVALGVLRIAMAVRKRKVGGSTADHVSAGGLAAVVVPVAIMVGIIVGVVAEEDSFFRLARWFAFIGLVNRESSKRPLSYVLYRNDRGNLNRDPVMDGRPFGQASREAQWLRVYLEKEKEGRIIEGWPRYYDLRREPSELVLSPACEVEEAADGSVRIKPVKGVGVIIYEEKIVAIHLVDRASPCAKYWSTSPGARTEK
jgi:Family of unknown function (DUF6338)